MAVPLFLACQSTGYLMRVESENYTAYTFTLRLSAKEEALLNESAILRGVRHINGQPWQAQEYLALLGAMAGFEVSIDRSQGDFIYLVFIRAVKRDPTSDATQSHNAAMPLQPHSRNLFVVTYRYSGISPLNSYRIQYDAPPQGSLFHVFKYGIDDKFPAFNKAFPFADSAIFEPNNFRVSFIMRTRSRYTVTGTNIRTFNRTSGYFYYSFNARFDASATNQILFYITRPNPIGWYLLAILLGIISIAITILITKIIKITQAKNACA